MRHARSLISPSWNRPLYEPSKRRLTWPNGAQATCYSAGEPDLLRGPQHDAAAADELASWARAQEAWDNLVMTLRLGDRPQVIVTTTPRPVKTIRALMASPTTVVTRGSTFDNAANLAPAALAEYRARYEGTRVGRQELYGEVLEDVEGALWDHGLLDRTRVKVAPVMRRIVVAVDPSVSNSPDSDECGIVVCGAGEDGHFYVLEDCSLRASPDGWARRAVAAFDKWEADAVVAEVNNGGLLVEGVLRTVRGSLSYRAVHATRGKYVRAEPISALFEQDRAHIVGAMPALEEQLTRFVPGMPGDSPDRGDAMIWALTDLSAPMPGQGLLDWMKAEALGIQRTPVEPVHETKITHGTGSTPRKPDLPAARGKPGPKCAMCRDTSGHDDAGVPSARVPALPAAAAMKAREAVHAPPHTLADASSTITGTCTVNGCEQPARGNFCERHWKRLQRLRLKDPKLADSAVALGRVMAEPAQEQLSPFARLIESAIDLADCDSED